VRRVSLLRLIAVFTWTGLSSLGGGRSAYFHDALVRRRGFIRHDEFVQDFTLSQVLPGPNFSNLAVALGYRLAGIAGGVWGLLAIVLPGAVILVGVARLYLHGAFGGSATLLLRSLSAAVVGLSKDSCAMTWHQWHDEYPTDNRIGTSRSRAASRASSPHGYQSTGFSACWRR